MLIVRLSMFTLYLPLPGNAQDLRHDFIERQHAVSQACVGHGTGHAPDHTRRLILHQDPGPACFQNLYAAQTILPHASQDDGQHRAPINLRGRSKQSVHRGTARVLLRGLIQAYGMPPPAGGTFI